VTYNFWVSYLSPIFSLINKPDTDKNMQIRDIESAVQSNTWAQIEKHL
ncbi:uncharacterized protein METZ01_LOCUS121905, partial [marine metagenome]